MTATERTTPIAYVLGQMRHYYGNHSRYNRAGNIAELSPEELGRWTAAVEEQQTEIERLRAALVRERAAFIAYDDGNDYVPAGDYLKAARAALIAEGLLPPE